MDFVFQHASSVLLQLQCVLSVQKRCTATAKALQHHCKGSALLLC